MAGEDIGGYVLTELIGRGASSAVWRGVSALAPDNRSLDVAVKRLAVPDSDADRERLKREAAALAKVHHPNIIRVLGVVDDGPGIALLLDLADAGTLADHLRTYGPMPPDEVQRLLAPVASALHAAHRAGLVHRDVKPANVFLTSKGQALLGDFGIAHDAGRTQLTRTDMAVGTAAYLDPEVVNGADPSPASDQYGFGILLYESLTGTTPFSGPVPMAVLKAADAGSFVPLDRFTVGPLADTVERAFARRPDDRFASMADLAEAIGGPHLHTNMRPAGPLPAGGRLRADTSTDVLGQTTAFRRHIRPGTLAAATPVRSNSRRRSLIGVFVVLVLAACAAGGTILRARQAATIKDPVPLALPSCSPETQTQCVKSFIRTPGGLRVTFADQRTSEFAVGERNDALRVSNWLCGERATLALYRPRTGVLYFFDRWPDQRTDEPVKVVADQTGIRNAQAMMASDHNGDGCADFALETTTLRTWFVPVEQAGRLRALPDISSAAIVVGTQR